MIIKYRSNTSAKEQAKQVSKKIIKALESSFVKSGSVVANDKKHDNDSVYYLTTLDLLTKHGVTDVATAKEMLKMLTNKYVWSFSSIHANKASILIDGIDIEIHFINVNEDNQKKTLNCSFYVSGASENDAVNKVEKMITHASLNFKIVDVSKYFKIDDCFIVYMEIPLIENSLDEIRNVLFRFLNDWNFIGLKAYSEECVLDESIIELSILFKEAKL